MNESQESLDKEYFEEEEEAELDEEEFKHAKEKAEACKFAIEQFYDGFWRYISQRNVRFVLLIK